MLDLGLKIAQFTAVPCVVQKYLTLQDHQFTMQSLVLLCFVALAACAYANEYRPPAYVLGHPNAADDYSHPHHRHHRIHHHHHHRHPRDHPYPRDHLKPLGFWDHPHPRNDPHPREHLYPRDHPLPRYHPHPINYPLPRNYLLPRDHPHPRNYPLLRDHRYPRDLTWELNAAGGRVFGTLGSTDDSLFGTGGYRRDIFNDRRGRLQGTAYGTRTLGAGGDSSMYGGKLNWNNANDNIRAGLDIHKEIGRGSGMELSGDGVWKLDHNTRFVAGGNLHKRFGHERPEFGIQGAIEHDF